MSSNISSFVLQWSAPKPRLVSLSSPNRMKRHYPSCSLKFNALPTENNERTSFSAKVSLHQQTQSQEDDDSTKEEDVDPTKLLIDTIGDCLYSFVTKGELQVEYLGEALRTVDLIERLGIQRFFQPQIKQILESLYRKWNEKYGLTEANFTVLGFRLLRLHGYNVNADVLKILRDKDGGNFSAFLEENYNKECALMNLYKCSQIGFPEESKIMDEVEDFSKAQLLKLLSAEDFPHLDIKRREEIEFSLSCPRQYMMPRMEAKSIVRGSWYSSDVERKCIELASIDLEMLQKVYRQEMIKCERWFDEQGFKDMNFPKRGVLDNYVSSAMSLFEPQFSLYRLAFCKAYILILMLDELHDNTSHRGGLNLFREAFQRWDPSLVENHPSHKAVIESSQRYLTEIAPLVSKAQDRDLFPYIKEMWEEAIAAYNKEIEWRVSGYFPSFDEYLEVGRTTFGVSAVFSCITLFLTGERISDHAAKLISNDSRLLYLTAMIGRLANDIMTYKRESDEGQEAHAISCYMKEHLCTEEQAVEAMKKMGRATFRELELEIFNCRGIVPEPCIRAVLSLAQHCCILYRMVDSFRLTTDAKYLELVDDYMGY